MEEQIKRNILNEVRSSFSSNVNLDKTLEIYEAFCLLNTPVESGIKTEWISDLKQFYQMGETMSTCHNNLIGSESFFKKVLYVVDEAQYQAVKKEVGKGLYKTLEAIHAFDGFNPKLNLNTADYQKIENPLHAAIVRVYQLRNGQSHSSNDWSLSEMFLNIKSVLIATIYVVYLNRAKLEEACRKQTNNNQFGIETLMQSIVKSYNKKIASGFKYVTLLWETEQKGEETRRSRHMDINEIRNERNLILLGDAGSGKTTSMQYLEYQIADEYLRGKGQWIPALIELEKEYIGSPLIDMVCRRLNIPVVYCETLLNNGFIYVLVDGLNELTSISGEKKSFVVNAEQFMIKYPKTRVVFSDRQYSPIQINVSNKFLLKRMTRGDIIRYAHSRPEYNLEIETRLNEVLNQKQFQDIEFTPLMINQLLLSVSGNAPVIDGISGLVESYLDTLIRREYEEKRDMNAQPGRLDLCLMCISVMDMDEKGVRLLKAMSECSNAMHKYGTVFDTRECINLACQLGILKQNGDYIDFVVEEYRSYFLMRAMENDL